MKKIRISIVSYLNSRPFLRGLKDSAYISGNSELTTDNPAECARKVRSGEADLGLIPVAVLPELGNYKIYSDYCIGAKGKVGSVFLFSEVPLKEIKTIIADPQSRTSVALTKVLCKFFWKIDPEWISVEAYDSEYFRNVKGDTAAVVIGDRTFAIRDKFKFAYDLSEEWMLHTGLPFVFACWAGKNEISKEFLTEFNNALAEGVEDKSQVYKEESENYQGLNIRHYLENNITYYLDRNKQTAMELFLNLLSRLNA